jgi:hypothetical protein
MQHAADHTELADLARVIGAEYVPQPSRRASEAKEGRKSTSSGVEKADRELEQAQVSAK